MVSISARCKSSGATCRSAIPSVSAARQMQAEQAAAFINKTRAKDCPAVFAGDLNMGLARDLNHTEFSVHYVNQEDAASRCSSYKHMVGASALEDVICK